MASRLKEEEKNEKIIRGLLKNPANKRCINCNSLGPQYVCSNFWTFICTNCSGLHREFTHRVKSISMAKFTSQEVSALQEGGNERARQIFFKEWDPQLHSYPDSSHLDRLRDFIKQVYVERRYVGGKNIGDFSKAKGDREDYDERSNSDRSGSRSPPYSNRYDSRSPPHTEPALKSYENRVAEGLPIPGVSDHQKIVYISSPPMVRPVRDILDGDVPPLWVGEPPKMNGGKPSSNFLNIQSSVSSNKGSIDGSIVELKRVSSASLIDFSAESEPAAAGLAQDSIPQQTTSNVPASDNCGWASFDVSSKKTEDLESMFLQLSVANSTNSSAATIDSSSQSNLFSLTAQPTGPPYLENAQAIGPSFPAFMQSTDTSFPTTVRPTGQSFAATMRGGVVAPDGQVSRPVLQPSYGRGAVSYSHNLIETKTVGRKELPMDLFTGLYPTSASHPGWRIGPPHDLLDAMQHPVMMKPTTIPQNPSISLNPFDLANESAPASNPMHHSSASLQGVVPNDSNPLSSLADNSKLTADLSQWASPQFPHSLFSSPGPNMVQQFSHDLPHQLPSSFFPSMNQSAVAGSEAAAPYRRVTDSSIRGNPFG